MAVSGNSAAQPLEINELVKRFGQVTAVKGISLSVRDEPISNLWRRY